jgi:UDP-2,4-diacetamido-2,4,6-trideoxy-beta-L-altropyranose hydrolase
MGSEAVKRVAFRVDASARIGTGHLARCLTLADALRHRGAHVSFVCRHLPQHMASLLMEKTYDLRRLDDAVLHSVAADRGPYGDWLGVDQADDAQATVRALSDERWNWVVVDHYALDAIWENRLRVVAERVLVIDDIANRQHRADVLLDQNYYPDMARRYTGRVPPECRLLLGPGYALLREEFGRLHEQVRPRSGPARRAMVFFGGVDAGNYTEIALHALGQTASTDLHVDVVIGAQYSSRQKIQSECSRYGFDCHVQTPRMAQLMASADVSIGAAGSATWERCCLGLPALIISLADNQIDIARGVDLCGAGVYLGTQDVVALPILRDATRALLHDAARRQSLSRNAHSMVDGLGAGRVCDVLGA